MNKTKVIKIPSEIIQEKIYFVRGEKIMFDKDLAQLYGVETKALNLAVKRNQDRFPSDFCFRLNEKEFGILRFQFETSSHGGRRYFPNVFTEQGVAMLSSVLKSKRAVQVNIQIMRTFTQIRKMIISNRELREKLDAIEKKYDKQFRVVFETLKMLLLEEEKPKEKMGFK